VPDADRPLPRSSARVADALASRGHSAAIRLLEDSAASAAQAAAALGVAQRQIVKSLVFRGRESGDAVLALVGGESRVETGLLAAHLGEPVERPDADWVREQTGFAIGGVPPVGHARPLRTVADRGLEALDELWASAGTPHTVFALRGDELVALTGAELADITGAPAPPDERNGR
jgi:prolyl-tRNA editing enzyme YbaK/EbsC (Cys-tRNA(Pro) deacylase)